MRGLIIAGLSFLVMVVFAAATGLVVGNALVMAGVLR